MRAERACACASTRPTGVVDDRADVRPLWGRADAASLAARVQQDVLREHAEAPALAVDRAEPALRLLRRLRAPEQQRLAQRVHVGERRAQLVRHRGDERPARLGELVLSPQPERRGRGEPEAEEQHAAEHQPLAADGIAAST
jgi:hypothetical protein